MSEELEALILVDWRFLKKELHLPWARQYWRRLGVEGKAPAPIDIGSHRIAWRLQDVKNYLKDPIAWRREHAP